VRLSALLAPALPEAVRHDDRMRAGLIWLVEILEGLRRRPA